MNSISFALIAFWGHLTSHCSGALSESELVLTSMIFVFFIVHRTPSKNNTCQSSPEDWFKRRQKSVDNQYDVAPRMHGFNSSFHTNKSADLKTRSGLKDGSNKQTGKV